MNQKSNYIQISRIVLHNSSNPNKNYFQHAIAKNQVLTAVPLKEIIYQCQIVKYFKECS